MRDLTLTIAALIAHIVAVVADSGPSDAQFCVDGCYAALSLSSFAGSPSIEEGYYLELCTNRLHVQSIFACARKYCSEGDIQAGIEYFRNVCQEGGATLLDYAIVSNLSETDIDQLPEIAYGDAAVVNATSVPDQHLYDLGYRTERVWYKQLNLDLWFCKAIFIYWGLIVFGGLLYKITCQTLWRAHKVGKASYHAKIERMMRLAPILSSDYDLKFPPGLILPPHLQSFTIIIFVILNVVLCIVSYETFPDNTNYAAPETQLARYVADRAGYLSYANLPIFWLFGTRNNVLLWITGWDFSTFNRFHKWIAGVSTVEAVIHSIAYTIQAFLSGGFEEYSASWLEEYWYSGVIATITMSLILGFSVSWLRHRFYDFFLITHIALAIITLVTLFYHTKIFSGEFDGFLWPCVAVWVIDRLARSGRIALNLVGAKASRADVQYDAAADILRVDVSRVLTRYSKARSGTHLFVYMINQLRFWESHPFTLVGWRADSQSDKASRGHKSIDDSSPSSTHVSEWKYTLLIRPHRGFTSRLSSWRPDALSMSQPRLLFEGPYGEPLQVEKGTAKVLFIIGGSGISTAISGIYGLLEQKQVPTIHLIWAVRNKALVYSIFEQELHQAASSIQIEAFATQPENDEAESTLGEKYPSSKVSEFSVSTGRPDTRAIIQEEARDVEGILHVATCGPRSMMNDVRSAVTAQMRQGNFNIRYSSEPFAW